MLRSAEMTWRAEPTGLRRAAAQISSVTPTVTPPDAEPIHVAELRASRKPSTSSPLWSPKQMLMGE